VWWRVVGEGVLLELVEVMAAGIWVVEEVEEVEEVPREWLTGSIRCGRIFAYRHECRRPSCIREQQRYRGQVGTVRCVGGRERGGVAEEAEGS
jgi:hypothetical protein